MGFDGRGGHWPSLSVSGLWEVALERGSAAAAASEPAGTGRRRLHIDREALRASVWFWPACASLGALLLALLLMPVRPGQGVAWARWIWPSGTEAASTLLQAVATSVMTAVTVTFSLTVVALQLASQQFSPRLLREFARDRRTQTVLAVLLSTFVVSITGLRGMDPETPVPVLVVGLVYVLGILSGVVLLLFVGHIIRSLRVDTMMVTAHGRCLEVLQATYPDTREGEINAGDLALPEGGVHVTAPRSGLVKAVEQRPLVDVLERLRLVLLLEVQPGDHITVGTPIGRLWADDGEEPSEASARAVEESLAVAVEIGYERTPEQDVSLGLRQLADIAVKALSPSINDPATAVTALGFCADLLVRIQSRRLGPELHHGPDGSLRLATAGRDLRYFLELVCGASRRFASRDPLVLAALLRLLRDCAVHAADDGQRREIRRQIGLVLDSMEPGLIASDEEYVRDLARRAELALAGDAAMAYSDRAGETRSV